MKIVHPTDFSPCAEDARALAMRLARALGGDLILVHVTVDTPLFREGLMRHARVGALLRGAADLGPGDVGRAGGRLPRARRSYARPCRGRRRPLPGDRGYRPAGGCRLHRDGYPRARRSRTPLRRQRGGPGHPDCAVPGGHDTRSERSHRGARGQRRPVRPRRPTRKLGHRRAGLSSTYACFSPA